MACPIEWGVWMSDPMSDGRVHVRLVGCEGRTVLDSYLPAALVSLDTSKQLYSVLKELDSPARLTA